MRYKGVNKFATNCAGCKGPVAANAGKLFKARSGAWLVYHLPCKTDAGSPRSRRPAVTTSRTSGGTFIQNANGRCEDAPCCGCCTC